MNDRHGHQNQHRMARIDGCPNCVNNTETPYRVEDSETSTPEFPSFKAWYRCTACLYSWRTWWSEDGQPITAVTLGELLAGGDES